MDRNCLMDQSDGDTSDVRITAIGSLDAGKSTLISVLTRTIRDDGHGSARKELTNYNPKKDNGNTTDLGQEIMGFDEADQFVHFEYTAEKRKTYWKDVMYRAKRLVTFIDLCGQESKLKTTMAGLVGHKPDYSMVVLGADQGVQSITSEHIGIAYTLSMPFFVVITKTDLE